MRIGKMSRVVLSHLQEIRQRLRNQDETLRTVTLWPETKPMLSSTYIAMFLEETKIQRALNDCLQACAASTVVTDLHLGNLPEPDLEAALLTLAKSQQRQSQQQNTGKDNKDDGGALINLRELYIGPLNASSSLSGKVLTKLLQNLAGSQLRVLDCPCRVRLPNQAAVEALAAAIGQLPQLQNLRLHVVPRTNIERPTIRLDSLLRVACDFDSFELIAGYPQHNPYQAPVVTCQTVAQFIPQNPAIRVLALANLGIQARHVQALLQGPWPSLLEHLCLLYNPRLGSNEDSINYYPWAGLMAQKLQDPQHTALQQVATPRPCLAIDVWTTLNRHGRARLTQTTQGSVSHTQAWQEIMVSTRNETNERLRVNLAWTLIRQHPALAVQTLASS